MGVMGRGYKIFQEKIYQSAHPPFLCILKDFFFFEFEN